MRTRAQLLFSLALVVLFDCQAYAANPESWADQRLATRDGLIVWLDGSVQGAAAKANGREPAASGGKLEYWYDGSGNKRHVGQPNEAARPVIRSEGQLTAVRFDGRKTCLSLDNLGLALDDATIFIVAAPVRNEGLFRALMCMHAKGQFDFVSGLNIDLGPFGSTAFDTVNVEGAGAGGVHNLRRERGPFLQFHRLCITSTVGAEGVTLHVDGKAEGSRARTAAPMHMDELIIGGRYYGGYDSPRGFFAGDIAEVLIYNRPLGEAERASVDAYLAAKYDNLGPVPPLADPPGTNIIPRVASPPVVQMLTPGFSVRELPVDLSNINNVQYRDDGKLVALGYDGNVHLLTDADGDGLEDHDELFWKNDGQLSAPIGMALTPPEYKPGRGLVVAAKSKCLLILDADGDDQADKQVVVASGWTELPHGVDALGAAFDPHDQSIYFGLGTANFTDAYLLKGRDKAQYKLDSERGTILRVAPDLKSREIVATGIRFPVAIRFNKAGDLFCTDQEGATWLSNGNPFDELLHVQSGRHYGFPPRHPRHLPNVIDEPSVFDYRPQHQSTCGLNFNEPSTDGSIFGPQWWKSDALVTGYSRGKLYRTKLAKTDVGYVAQNQLLGSMTMLPADACVAPGGSLLIAAHSGGSDWGSGPSGRGKLYKVKWESAQTPAPSLVWAAGPQEIRIAFDQPLDPEALKGLAGKIAIEGGEFAAAADRLERVRPGYATVEYQQNAPRFGVDVQAVQLTADRRTLILSTAAQSAAVNYAIVMRGVQLSPAAGKTSHQIQQLPDIDLQYDLAGVEATYESPDGEKSTAWLPHMDLEVSRAFTVASADHDQFWRQAAAPGTLVLRSSLNLGNMLRPAVRPGATIDYEWPQEEVTLTLKSNESFSVTLGDQATAAVRDASGEWTVERTVAGSTDHNYPLEVRLKHQSSEAAPKLTINYRTQEDARPRTLAIRRLLLPWARPSTDQPAIVDNASLPELAGGNWLRGRKEFFGSEAGCSKCHKVGGEGGSIGPDLSNLPKRDYASVLRDVTKPSFAINPDFVSHLVVTADGRVLAGTVRTEGEHLVVSDQEGKQTLVPREEVEEVQASEQSIMPEGIPKALGPARFRDLLTFLLVEPPSMPVYGELPPPEPRSAKEVDAILAGSKPAELKRQLNVTLVSGPKDHGLGEHDYPAWQKAWQRLLGMDEKVTVSTANPWPSEEQLRSADVLVFYQQGAWTPERARDIDRFLKRGGGLVYIHFAVDGGTDPAGFAERIGLAWRGGASKFRHGPLDLQFTSSKHPVARNFDRVHLYDESYWNLLGDAKRINLLATGVEEGKPQPLFWTVEPAAGGRVFVSIPGHFAWTFDDPLFRVLLLRGIAWTANESVDRFNELVLPGARVSAPAPANQ